mmetsp:Transcript_352/g.832  ORF Transcript_352/g.832 Transcript_352/m.832 type:complete len:468 (+) Transcript_352:748-2151(+)
MFSEHDAGAAVGVAAHEADGFRRHDLVGSLVLDHAVLVDARFVHEGVRADDGLVRLTHHAGVVGDHAGGGRDVYGIDGRVQFPAADAAVPVPEIRPPLEGEAHDDLLQTGVPRPLADPVDRTLELPRPVPRPAQAVRGGQPQVVLAVRAEHHVLRPRHVFPQVPDELPELPRHVPPRRVGDVEGRRARQDGRLQHPAQKHGVAPPRVLRTELHVVAPQRPRIFHRPHRDLHHLVRGLLQLRRHVDLRRGDERVDPRPHRALDGVPRPQDVLLVRAAQPADDRHVAVLERLVADHVGDALHPLEIVGGGDGEARLDDVHAQPGEVAGDLQFFGGRQRGARALFAVAEGRVEDADVVGVVDAPGDVGGAGTAGSDGRGRTVVGHAEGGGGASHGSISSLDGGGGTGGEGGGGKCCGVLGRRRGSQKGEGARCEGQLHGGGIEYKDVFVIGCYNCRNSTKFIPIAHSRWR